MTTADSALTVFVRSNPTFDVRPISQSAMKRRIHEILEAGNNEDGFSRLVDVALLVLIMSNVAALVVSTDRRIYEAAPNFFLWFEGVSFCIFAVEYMLRVWACTAEPGYEKPVTGRLRYMMRPLMISDAVAVFSFFIILAVPPDSGVNLGVLRALRLISRTARLARYSPGMQALTLAVSSRRNELLAVVSVVGALLILASSLMYYVEQAAQPDKFSSIPATMWWGIITVTTVGYGDVAPVTPLGRFLAGVISLLGIGIFALPAGILGSGFMEQVGRRRYGAARTCPHCGKEIE